MTIDRELLIKPDFPYPNDASIPNPTPLTFGTHYRFQRAGVTLEPHTHTDENAHFTICVSGSFMMLQDGVERSIVAGDVVNVGNTEHSFIALQDESVIINVTKYGTQAQEEITKVRDALIVIEDIIKTLQTA